MDGAPTRPESTAAILRRSSFRVEPGVFVYAQVREAPRSGEHLLVARDGLEITVVTRPDSLATLDVVKTNPDRWVLLSVDCANPFYCVGFIAAISRELTALGVDILVISTFSRDLFLVKEADVEKARGGLKAVGIAEH